MRDGDKDTHENKEMHLDKETLHRYKETYIDKRSDWGKRKSQTGTCEVREIKRHR